MRVPCKDCIKRHERCHGSCEEYLQFQKVLQEGRKQDQAMGAISGMFKKRSAKARRGLRKHIKTRRYEGG